MSTGAGNSSNRDTRKASLAERRNIALHHRKQGRSYEWIARNVPEVGVTTRSSVERMCKAAIKEITRENAAEALALELERLDDIWQIAFPDALSGNLWAIDRCLAISEKRAKWLDFENGVNDNGAAEIGRALHGFLLDAKARAEQIQKAATLPTDAEG